ncbi:hypothetical protein CRENBAI_004944 [Crenichthys baileyi]|uniref:Uncharacterized protein n=1 Tax=Crenichthys baileyi TaxID=28760 RepID=A0AAV9QQQ7_9TELE
MSPIKANLVSRSVETKRASGPKGAPCGVQQQPASEDSVAKGYLLDFACWSIAFDWISVWLATTLIPSSLSIWTLRVSCPPSHVSHLNLDYLMVFAPPQNSTRRKHQDEHCFYGLKPRIPQPLATSNQ